MKKPHLLPVLLALLLLTACGEAPAPVQTPEPTPAVTPEPTPEPPGAPTVDYCELSTEYTENAEEIGTLTAYDGAGKLLWDYVTEPFSCTELEQVQSVGPGKDGWLLLCGGELRCIADGKAVWVNKDFGGAGACWSFGPDGTLYLAGYYGPHLMAVDENGKTLGRWESFDSDAYWPGELTVTDDGMVELSFYSNRSVLRVDPETGTYAHAGWNYDGIYEDPIFVSDVTELVEAIGPGAVILLEPGEYNLTEYLEHNYLPGGWGEDSERQPTGVLVNFKYDGPELMISGINDLVLRSADPNHPAEIVCTPRYADVLRFYNCDNLELVDLVLGHTPEQGTCVGMVLELEGCRDPGLFGLDLYGCGAYAIYAKDCRSVYCFLGKLHDCSYGIALLENVNYTQFDNVTFSDCGEYTAFELTDSSAEFFYCGFSRPGGNLISCFGNSSALFSYCDFDEAASASLWSNPQLGTQITIEE